MTSVLGVNVGTKVEEAHAKLDKLSEGGKATKEESEEEEGDRGARKILWQFIGTDYSALFIKTNDEGEVTNITAFLREGKEIPFDKIGEVKKAPLANANGIAWDVIRPNRPLFRVVAEGAENKAKTISIFLVKRRSPDKQIILKPKPTPSLSR